MTTAAPLMAGKKGLIMGLANDKSIAWGIAQALDAQGAQIAFSYQNEALEKRVKPLSETLSFEPTLIQCDVTDSASVEACFKELGEKWGKIDFVVHAIAFSDKNELKGRTIDTTLPNFLNTMHISCYSLLVKNMHIQRMNGNTICFFIEPPKTKSPVQNARGHCDLCELFDMSCLAILFPFGFRDKPIICFAFNMSQRAIFSDYKAFIVWMDKYLVFSFFQNSADKNTLFIDARKVAKMAFFIVNCRKVCNRCSFQNSGHYRLFEKRF